MEEIVEKLIEFEDRFGSSIFADRNRLMALIRDYFPDMKREQNLIDKGLELNIYGKINATDLKDIYLLRQQFMSVLLEDYGLSEESARDVVFVWIRLLEKQNEINIDDYSPKVITSNSKIIKTLTPKIVSSLYDKISTAKVVMSDIKAEIVKNVEVGKEEIKKRVIHYEKVKGSKPNVYQYVVAKDKKEDEEIFNDAISNLVKGENQNSFEKFKELANKDFAPAQGVVGLCYYNGTTVKKDYEEAVKWFKKAAINGQSSSQNLLGYCYGNGLGVPQDYTEAVKWYKKSVAQGDVQAQNNLAYCYFNGLGVVKDVDKAIELFQKAANNGLVSAQVSLGSCYFNGNGIDVDYKKAIYWYSKAAEQGDANAQYYLGECYLKGQGVDKSKYQALKWLSMSASSGHRGAEVLLDDLEHFRKRLELRDKIEKKTVSVDKERYAQKYCRDIIRSITYDDLENKTQPSVDDLNLLEVLESKIDTLDIQLSNEEYPILLFNNSIVPAFMDGVVLTTSGLYIFTVLRKMKFIYYSDVLNIEIVDGKKIKINKYFISTTTLEERSVLALYDIIYKMWRDFR